MNYDDFEIIKEKGLDFYKNINEVFCPYLQKMVIFNHNGVDHLYFRNRNRSRKKQDQYMRFKLIKIIPEILKRSHTLQGLLETKKFEKQRIHNRTELIFKHVTYYEFIALHKRNRIKIIVKQIESSQPFFWSIIPFWRMNKRLKERLLYEGIPEED